MNPQKTTRLIDYLADKTLSFGCMLEHPEYNENGHWIITCVRDEYYCAEQPKTGANVGFYKSAFKQGVKILGHPIRIGDVLSKISTEKIQSMLPPEKEGSAIRYKTLEVLYWKWKPCVFTKSLQELIEESGWDEVCNIEHYPGQKECTSFKYNNCEKVQQLKSPQTRALVEFLGNIFLK